MDGVWLFLAGVFVLALMSQIIFLLPAVGSGWRQLARAYGVNRADRPQTYFEMQESYFNGIGYSNLVWAQPTAEGLHLRVRLRWALPFRPLCVPWSAVVGGDLLPLREYVPGKDEERAHAPLSAAERDDYLQTLTAEPYTMSLVLRLQPPDEGAESFPVVLVTEHATAFLPYLPTMDTE